jgi:hypothetical protein
MARPSSGWEATGILLLIGGYVLWQVFDNRVIIYRTAGITAIMIGAHFARVHHQ